MEVIGFRAAREITHEELSHAPTRRTLVLPLPVRLTAVLF
jgi:hypothetical protein